MMKQKYLMRGMAALALCAAFVSCSHDESELQTQAQIDKAKYDVAFKEYIGGNVSPSQDWGFGGSAVNGSRLMTRANPGETVPATSTGINANANEWADPDKYYGGWQVPDPLTEGQKLRVMKYFQANPNLTYEDPHFRHFFIQQVYKGGTSVPSTTPETITAANGSTYTSNHMDLLTVGTNHQHINNFNSGDGSNTSVLDNGSSVNNGTYHQDKIMLMVNIDDTSCFGYHESGVSIHVDNKAALVAAAVIDEWAAKNGNPGEAVVDKWNRSFLGFDHAIMEGEQAYAKDGNGETVYATYSQAPESPQYVWDGEKVVQITTGEYETVEVGNETSTWTETRPVYKDEYKTIMNLGWLTTNENFYVAADKVTLDQSYQVNGGPDNLDGVKNAVILKEFTVDGTKYQSVINLPRIKQLADAGYLPVKDKNLQNWVKVGTSDCYFSDWIVTLAEAKKIVVEEEFDLRVIAEDLSATSASDFDFNDVVFDVKYGDNAKIRLLAAGGTLKLRLDGNDAYEVHQLFDVDQDYMVNTNALGKGLKGNARDMEPVVFNLGRAIYSPADAKDIKVEVFKNGEWQELTAVKGEPATKIAVGVDYEWLDERTSIKDEYPLFVGWADGTNFVSKWWE